MVMHKRCAKPSNKNEEQEYKYLYSFYFGMEAFPDAPDVRA